VSDPRRAARPSDESPCDNLMSVDVVTAEGKLLVASGKEKADLF